MSPPLLTVREAAESLGVGLARVYQLAADGRLRPLRVPTGQGTHGVRLMLRRADVDAYRGWRDRLNSLRSQAPPGARLEPEPSPAP